MANIRVKLKQGSATLVDQYVGPIGELVIRDGGGDIRIQDGTTLGGSAIVPVTYLISTPSMTSPLSGATGVGIVPVLTATAMVGDGVHVASFWQVALDAAFNAIIFDSGRDTVNLTNMDLSATSTVLSSGLTYYARVRHESSLAPLSPWAVEVGFTVASAAVTTEEAILFASDALGSDRFGQSVSVSGDGSTIAVGSYLQDSNGTDGGQVYIFRMSGGTWVETDIIPNPGGAGDRFGYSVALNIDGAFCAIGAYMMDDAGVDDGSVYVFKDRQPWKEQDFLVGNGNNGDQVGISVAISDDATLVISGANLADVNGTSSGAVYAWWDDGGGFLKPVELIGNNTIYGDQVGISVAMCGDGSRFIVGAQMFNVPSGEVDAGAAYIFDHDGKGGFSEVAALVSPVAEAYGYFGYSVDIDSSGTIAVVGSYGSDLTTPNAGGAYVFTETNGNWDAGQRIVASTSTDGDAFGRSVCISGNGSTILVGAYAVNAVAGAAYIFGVDAAGQWAQTSSTITASNSTSYDYYGISVSLNDAGTVGVVGAFGEGTNGNEAGAAYVLI